VGNFAGSQGDALLGEVMRDVEARTAALIAAATVLEPDALSLPKIHNIADYVDERARDQENWHIRAARKRMRIEARWRGAEVLATLTAALISAIGIETKVQDLAIWVGVATTIATALTAYRAREQHARIAAGYARTANNLGRLLSQFDVNTADDAESATFVNDIESVLSQEDTNWSTQTTT
jgi:hypothetical protein